MMSPHRSRGVGVGDGAVACAGTNARLPSRLCSLASSVVLLSSLTTVAAVEEGHMNVSSVVLAYRDGACDARTKGSRVVEKGDDCGVTTYEW